MAAKREVELPAGLRLGPIELTVTDLDRSARFYEDSLGLDLQRREDDTAVMGSGGEDLVTLVEDRSARPPGREAGLYHFALLYPSRTALARALRRLAATSTPIEGAADHGVSEAIYLPDPDGNGIELYADRPRDQWPAPSSPGERVGIYTIGLDLHSLLDAAGPEGVEQGGDGPGMGHLHLYVGDVDRGLRFYRDVLGFEQMAHLGRSAAFVAAGGYHHHLGFNTWRGRGIPPASPDAVGLRHWTIVLDDDAQVGSVRERVAAAGIAIEDRDGGFLVRDPWGIPLLVTRRTSRTPTRARD
jgi:catechol 2,3-dioxygenase